MKKEVGFKLDNRWGKGMVEGEKKGRGES